MSWVIGIIAYYGYLTLAHRIIYATDSRKGRLLTAIFMGMVLANIGGCAYARFTGVSACDLPAA